MSPVPRAPYMEWAKSRRVPTFDLAGSNLMGCTLDDLPGAREALEFTGSNEHGYIPLLEAIAGRYGVTTDRVALGTGTSGANFLAYAALLRPGDDVVVERPGYDPLVAAARLLGANVTRFDRRFEEGYALRPDAVEAVLTPNTRLIVVTNPHNPTGAFASAAELEAIGRVARRIGARVLVDEVYLDGVFDLPHSPAATHGDHFVSTSSLNKSWGLNVLRCGWVIASADLVERIRRVRGIVDAIGSVALERLAALAFTHLDRLAARARAIIEPNRDLVAAFVERRPELEWVRPLGGSLAFPRLRGVETVDRFVANLLDAHDTAVVPGRFFEAPNHFRIAYGGPSDKVRGGLAAIEGALNEI